MQSTINLPIVTPIGLRATRLATQQGLSLRPSNIPKIQSFRRFQLLKTAVVSDNDTSPTVDYTSMTSSVFPAEACETLGGESCEVEMYPEVKLESSKSEEASVASEPVDREYLQYDGPKTVFPGEACDDLGGEFCDPEYQTGVY